MSFGSVIFYTVNNYFHLQDATSENVEFFAFVPPALAKLSPRPTKETCATMNIREATRLVVSLMRGAFSKIFRLRWIAKNQSFFARTFGARTENRIDIASRVAVLEDENSCDVHAWTSISLEKPHICP